ncbi:MAG: phosphatidylcholine/phosphatidylserine synthase [Saprospiraceae bacterium]
MKKYIPNSITLLNLFFGCCALVSIFNQQYFSTFVFLALGGLADYADGMIARLLKVHSTLGKELDSMADMVSFGVAPGAILYVLLSLSFPTAEAAICYPALPAFLVSMFAGLRLARFNLDTRQTEDFIGLNTPSSTMFVVGLMLIYANDSLGLAEWVIQPVFLYIVIAVLSFLLVAELPMFGFKFKGLHWKGNEIRWSFIVLSLILVVFLKEAAFALIIFLYILLALINFWFFAKNDQ